MSELLYDRVKEFPLENVAPRRYVPDPGEQPPLPHPHREGDQVTVHPLGKDMGRYRGKVGTVLWVHDDGGIEVDVTGHVIGVGWTAVTAVGS